MNDPRHHGTDAKSVDSKRLTTALSDLHSSNPAVPPEVDEAVLRTARSHLRNVRAKPTTRLDRIRVFVNGWLDAINNSIRGSGRRVTPWATAAAVLAVTFALGLIFHRPAENTLAVDLNRDGNVDIRDALILAQQIERGAQLNHGLDLNGDGTVDRQDAEALARSAVRLNPGRPL